MQEERLQVADDNRPAAVDHEEPGLQGGPKGSGVPRGEGQADKVGRHASLLAAGYPSALHGTAVANVLQRTQISYYSKASNHKVIVVPTIVPVWIAGLLRACHNHTPLTRPCDLFF